MANPKPTDEHSVQGDNIHVEIGDHAHNIAAGKNVSQMTSQHSNNPITQNDLAAVQDIFKSLMQQVQKQSPPEKRASAIERVEELEETIVSEQPDLTTMEYIKKWFEKNLPDLAGAIVSVLVHPVVGKIVEAAGELTSGELKRRFGKREKK